MAIATLANMQKIFVKHTTRSTGTSTTEVADSEHSCTRPSRPKRSRDQKSRDNSELSRLRKERDASSMALIPLQNPTSDKAAHNRTVAEKQVLELEKKIKALESGDVVKHTSKHEITKVDDKRRTCDRPSRPKRSRDQKSRDNSELSRLRKERDASSMALIPLQNPTSDKAAHNRT